VDQKRLVGVVAGLLMLAGVFLLPFTNFTGSLASIAYGVATDPTTGFASILAVEIILILATVLIVIAGLIGLRPKVSGVLGIVGSVVLIVNGYLNPSSTVNFAVTDYRWGMYLILIGALIALAVGLSLRDKRPATLQAPAQPQTQPMPPPQAMSPPPPQWQTRPPNQARYCRNCGQQVGAGARFCRNCGASIA
jgi:hypothetical protein